MANTVGHNFESSTNWKEKKLLFFLTLLYRLENTPLIAFADIGRILAPSLMSANLTHGDSFRLEIADQLYERDCDVPNIESLQSLADGGKWLAWDTADDHIHRA